jgi:hypothetical protein
MNNSAIVRNKEKFFELVERVRDKDNEIDCIVAFSGGKDSAYLLHYFKKKLGLRVAAYSMDTSFMSDLALKNIKIVTDKLKIPLIFDRPPRSLFLKLYSSLLRYPSKHAKISYVCDLCSIVYESGLLMAAARSGIPIAALGYSPYQPIEFDFIMPIDMLRESWLLKEIEEIGLSENEKSFFWDPRELDIKRWPKLICPFHAIGYNFSEIVETVKGEEILDDTSLDPLLTNCRINELMMHFDSKRFGRIVYEDEITRMQYLLQLMKALQVYL